MTPLARQIAKEVGEAAAPLGALLGPDMVVELDRRIRSNAPMWAAQLTDDDDRLAAQTVIDLMAVLPDPEPQWWRTPLGRVVAASVGTEDAEAVRASVAAAMLGISPSRVHDLAGRGKLDRHPDGGIVRASVMRRLVG